MLFVQRDEIGGGKAYERALYQAHVNVTVPRWTARTAQWAARNTKTALQLEAIESHTRAITSIYFSSEI